MSNKKPSPNRLQNTLDDLDTAIEQWDSLTNKPQREQVSGETKLQKRAKTLLKELRDQIDKFDTIKGPEGSDPKEPITKTQNPHTEA